MQVLQRKTEEAAAATKRLKELLEARKSNKENATSGILQLNLCICHYNRFCILPDEVPFKFIAHVRSFICDINFIYSLTCAISYTN